MDLMNLKPTSDTVEVVLKHPSTLDDLTKDDGSGMTITLHASHSKEYKKVVHDQQDRRIKMMQKKAKTQITAQDIERDAIELLAKVTADWNITYGGEQPNERVAVGFYNTASGFRTCIPLNPEMRVAPTLSVSADADWRIEHNGSSNTNTAHSLDQPSSKVASINVTTNKTGSGGDAGQLMASSNSARLKLDADI